MPNLLEGSSPLEVEYAVSLSHSLVSNLGMLCAAPNFEGLGEWLHSARNRLPDELLDELCLLITFAGRHQRFTTELLATLPAGAFGLSFEELMAYLQSLSGSEVQQVALRALARGTTPRPAPASLLALMEKPAEWAAYLESVESEAAPQLVASLVRDGEALKKKILTVIGQFWHKVYAQEFEATRPMMERSVIHHQTLPHSPNFQDLFVAVTGRLIPDTLTELLPKITRVTFIPSCYIGPYVAYAHYDDHLILYYNCRSTPVRPTAASGASLYPPLKALADETRLQILALLHNREMYAQEIVDQLDISQPAVSRHLNLMAAARVLSIRREGNAKYYTVNRETLAGLADALRVFV